MKFVFSWFLWLGLRYEQPRKSVALLSIFVCLILGCSINLALRLFCFFLGLHPDEGAVPLDSYSHELRV